MCYNYQLWPEGEEVGGKELTSIIEAIRQNVKYDVSRLVQRIQGDTDRFLVLVLTVSIFAPFYVSMVCVIGIALMTMLNCKKRVRAFEAPYTKFLFVFLTSAFFVAATYGNDIGMVYSILMYAIAGCALYVRSVMTRSLFNDAMDLACVGSIWCLFIALYQKASAFTAAPGYRPVSVFDNANYYGMIIEFVVLIALYRIFTNPDLAAFYFTVIGLNLIGLYLTASFSAFAALCCAVTLMLCLKGKRRHAFCFVIAVLVLVELASAFPLILPRGSDAIDHTLAQRLSIWSTSLKGIEQHPFFGQGVGSYQMVYERFAGYKTYHCHNLFLDVLLNFGVVGFGALGVYAAVQAKLLYLRFRNNICFDMNVLLTCAAFAVCVHGMTDVTILWIQTAALFTMIYASTGIASNYVERVIRRPAFLPGYAEEPAAGVYLKD